MSLGSFLFGGGDGGLGAKRKQVAIATEQSRIAGAKARGLLKRTATGLGTAYDDAGLAASRSADVARRSILDSTSTAGRNIASGLANRGHIGSMFAANYRRGLQQANTNALQGVNASLGGTLGDIGIGRASALSGVYGQIGNSYAIQGQQMGGLQNSLAEAEASHRRRGLGDLIGAAAPWIALAVSDRRLKTNIEERGVSPSGIPVYEFSYHGSNKRYQGVMADEVEHISGAVMRNKDGYAFVNYSALDVEFKEVD